MTTETIKSWEATGSVFIDEVGFLEPGKALYLYDGVDGTKKYIDGTAPKDQSDIESIMCDAALNFDNLYAILMSHRDFKAYNNLSVYKETVKF